MENLHTFNPADYPNLLPKIKLTSSEILSIITNYKLSFSNIRNEMVEWEIRFPMFVQPFYNYVLNRNCIPNQQEYYDHYIASNIDYFNIHNIDSQTHEALKARIYRTYPSIVRDIHFNKYLAENLAGVDALYNIKLDVEEGIDIMIIKKNQYFGVNLYTDTKRAYIGRAAKKFRHTTFHNVQYIELPVNFSGSLKCGAFFLYGKIEFMELVKRIGL